MVRKSSRVAAVVCVALLAIAWIPGVEASVGRDVAGMAIAGSDDHVYIWYRDGTVSSGNSRRLDRHRRPYAYSTAPGQSPYSIVATAIAKSNDWTYVWYANGMVSAGSTDDLDRRRASYAYSMPPGLTPGDIVAITISSADHVFAWYANGTYTEGTSKDLDAYSGPIGYKLAPGYTADDVLGMATASDNRVYAWYDDGYTSVGAPNDLDAFVAKRPYSQSLFLKSDWGPETRLAVQIVTPEILEAIAGAGRGDRVAERVDPREGPAPRNSRVIRRVAPEDLQITADAEEENGLAGRVDPGGVVSEAFAEVDRSGLGSAVQAVLRPPFDTTINSIDPFLAAGRQYLVASQYQQLEFLGKLGQPLPEQNGIAAVVDSNDLFAAFLWDSSEQTPTDVNLHTGFPRDCDDPSYPQTSLSARACIVESYDVRVFNNPASDHWIVIANLRNKMVTDIWSSDPDRYERKYKEKTGVEADMCGHYKPAGGSGTYTDDVEICGLARRHVAIAVSKTPDPRDGFHLYAISTNNYRDFPWATINGDVLLINHHGTEMIDGAVATGVSLADLESGKHRPSYFQYFRGDVDNHYRMLTPQHGGGTDGLTVMYEAGSSRTTLYAFPQPTARFQKPPLAKAVAEVPGNWPAYYRDAFFHMAGHHNVEGYPPANMRRNIMYTRLPVNRAFAGAWSISTSKDAAQGYRRVSFGKNSPDDPASEIWSYEEPALAVNANGDVVIAYGRMPVYTTDTRFPDARYTVWYHDEPAHRPSSALISGQAQPRIDEDTARRIRPSFVHHVGATVDPQDPTTVWVTHVYLKKADTKRYYQQFVARVRP